MAGRPSSRSCYRDSRAWPHSISKPGGPSPDMDDATASPGAPPLPDVLNALLAFIAEHQRCGDLDGGGDNALVWLTCSCGAHVAHPASASHPATADGASRK